MIDGLKVVCKGHDPQKWRGLNLLDFARPVSIDTGELQGRNSEARRYGLTFRITDTEDGGGACSFFGSLHTHRNEGEENSDLFTFGEVAEEVERLERWYHIQPETAYLRALEFGVNIPVKYRPMRLINKAMLHKREELVTVSKRECKARGKEAVRRRYSVKLYEKNGGQKDEAGNYILRFELRYNDLEQIAKQYDIKTLADLKDRKKVKALQSLLIQAAEDVFFFDRKADPQGLTDKQLYKWWRYSNADFWKEERRGGSLSKKAYQREKQRCEELRAKGGVFDTGKYFVNLVKMAVTKYDKTSTKTGYFWESETESKKHKDLGTFGKLGLTFPKVTIRAGRKLSPLQGKNDVKFTTQKRRFCKTCGREISDQHSRSIFCSERLYGKEAKKCRNKDSNTRATKRRIIQKAMQQEKKILITYDYKGEEYTDELRPCDLYLSREWVDRVTRVRVKEDKVEKEATGAAARRLLWQLQDEAPPPPQIAQQ